MTYQQFILMTKEKLEASLDSHMNLQLHTVLKNNGKERTGISFINKNINISPTIYLEEYYTKYQNGYPLEYIVDMILDIYSDVKCENPWDVSVLKDFFQVEDKIAFKIISAEKNETFLKTMPYIAYHNFAIVFFILHKVDDTGTATIPIHDALLNYWEKSVDELFQTALKNMPTLLPASIKPMQSVIRELIDDDLNIVLPEEELMYVATNTRGVFGASCILYPNLLQEIAETLNEDYYLLPSSIHEMIIVPKSKSPSTEDLLEMVKDINETQVDPEEVLCDSVYFYNHKESTLICV